MSNPKVSILAGVLILAASSCLAACSQSAQIIREGSSPQKPLWTEHPPPPDDVYSYFVGISATAENPEDADTSAKQDADSKIANFLGTKIHSEFVDLENERGQSVFSLNKSKSSALIRMAEVVDSYRERVTRIDPNATRIKYESWILERFPRAEAEKERSRQQQAKLNIARAAYQTSVRGRKAWDANHWSEAERLYREALGSLAELDDDVPLTSENEFKSTSELVSQLKALHTEAVAQLHRISVYVTVRGVEGGQLAFSGALALSLTQHGFTIASRAASYSVSGEISARASGMVLGNQVGHAEGLISVRRLEDGQIVAAVPVKAKGFHRSADEAIREALRDAGADVGEKLAAALTEQSGKSI